jgi:hypothetical protein
MHSSDYCVQGRLFVVIPVHPAGSHDRYSCGVFVQVWISWAQPPPSRQASYAQTRARRANAQRAGDPQRPHRRGARAQRSLPQSADRPDPADAGVRQGLERGGGRASDRCRRRALPRPVRWLRRVRDRAQPPRGDRRDRAGDGCPHGQHAPAWRDAAQRGSGRAVARTRTGKRRRDGAGQHGHRGRRGGHQDLARGDEAPTRAVRRARLPRAYPGLAVAQRRCRVSRGFRAAVARL